jgi:hypothetical protein
MGVNCYLKKKKNQGWFLPAPSNAPSVNTETERMGLPNLDCSPSETMS